MKTAIGSYLDVMEEMKRWSFEKHGTFGVYETIAEQLRAYQKVERELIIRAYEAGFNAGYTANENSYLNNKPSGAVYFHEKYGTNTTRNNESKVGPSQRKDEPERIQGDDHGA
jgi:hypothetical protein